MVLGERLYTFEEFWEFIHLPENTERRFELDDGAIIEMGASSKLNTIVESRLIYYLNAHVLPRDIGYVTTPDAGYKFGSRSYRQPDVGFISKEKVDSFVGSYFIGAPDLAIEVVSEDEDVFKKAREYLLAGTRYVWAVYAEEQSVFVLEMQTPGELISREYGMENTLDGGDVLPGFKLSVRDIFPA